MITYTRLIFSVEPEFAKEFVKEAERLKISRIELFRRMWKEWKKEKAGKEEDG